MKEAYRRFYQDVGKNYPESEIVYGSLRGKLRAQFVRSVMAGWTGRLLDLGCNTGEHLRAYSGGPAAGIDISLNCLEKAKEAGPSGFFILGDAENLQFLKSESFDHILCSEMLEHVFKPQIVMNAISRLLRTGGTCLITTPDYQGERPDWIQTGTLAAYGIRGMKGDRYFHTAFHAEELAAMARSSGLKVLEYGTLEKEVKYAAKGPAVLFVLIRWINAHVFRSPVLEKRNQALFDRFSTGIYRLVCRTGLNDWIVGRIRRGVRSYVVAGKTS